MWYLGIGSIRNMPYSAKNLMIDLAECLARTGYRLRTGGRGEVDDAFWQGASYCPDVEREMILPVKTYRQFEANGKDIISFDSLPEVVQQAARRHCALPSSRRHYTGRLKRLSDDVCALLVMGKELNAPVRFAITYAPGEKHGVKDVVDIGVSKDPIFATPDAAAFYLLKEMRVPVFNLANPEHCDRIVSYVNEHRYAVVS